MRAAVTTGSSIQVRDDVPDPTPGPGQVLVHTIVCGICGSDLHALAEPEEMAQLNAAGGATSIPPGTPYVLGHAFSAEIVGYGPKTEGRLRVGTTVCALPYAMGPTGMNVIGFSPTLPGGYGELMVLQEAMLMPVPEGLDARTAALTEPLAVGEHSVALADLRPGWPCHVVGCGPIGLAIIVALKARGAHPISASDLSPSRRAVAARLGADIVFDPTEGTGFPDFAELGVPTNPLQRSVSIGMGSEPPRAVIFEAVGKPGMIPQIIDAAPPGSRIVVARVNTHDDRFVPGAGDRQGTRAALRLRLFPERIRGDSGTCRTLPGGGGTTDHEHRRCRGSHGRDRSAARRRGNPSTHRALVHAAIPN
jgi:threonine dehydrogenase-like Zn-dependent dehydrogenase